MIPAPSFATIAVTGTASRKYPVNNAGSPTLAYNQNVR